MECNKDEAIRAMEIAEKKLQNSDFVGAKKFILKSKQLYPNLDNVSMVLAICEVHCSAQNKGNGSDVNWYDVLQLEKIADETTIKRHYRKLALLLHPDKNKFAGAESAFKLIGEASRVLSNAATRSVLDSKFNAFKKTSMSTPYFHPSSKGAFVNNHQDKEDDANISVNQQFMSKGPQKISQPSQRGTDKISTCCPHCRTSFEYIKVVLGRQISCQICKTLFTANETGASARHSNSSPSQSECYGCEGKYGSAHVDHKSTESKVSGGHSVRNSNPAPIAKAEFPANSPKQKFTNAGGVKSSAKKSFAQYVPRTLVLGLMANTFSSNNKKRERPEVVDSGRSSIRVGDVNAEAGQDKSNVKRNSCAGKTNNGSYTESLDNKGEYDKISKMPDIENNSTKNKNEGGMDKGLKDYDGYGSATSMNGVKKHVTTCNGTTSYEEMLSNKRRKLKKQSASNTVGEGVSDEFSLKVKQDTSLDNNGCPPKTSNFQRDKDKNCLDVDQIWAVYDRIDSMPRRYARVRGTLSTDFNLGITWLEPDRRGESHNTKWVDARLPFACGVFKYGTSEVTTDCRMFSHQMCFEPGRSRSTFLIYPRASEIWALFRNWDSSWANDPEKHKPYKFDPVVILSEFDQKEGVKVAYVEKIKGFVSLFRRITQEGVLSSFHIPPGNVFHFSHRIPAFQMPGAEKDGGPEGSYELDTACIPSDMDELDLDDITDGNVRKDTTSDVSFKHHTKSCENLMTGNKRAEIKDTSKKRSSDDAKHDFRDVKSSKAFSIKTQSFSRSGRAASTKDNDCVVATLQNPTAVIRRSARGLSSKKKSNQTFT